MTPKHVLIVEPDHGFGLSLAALFQQEGRTTRVAGSAAEAELEIVTRRPDLIVIRAELPDLSGFSLCARLRHDHATERLPLILYSSDTAPASLAEHARTPWAANGYLAMPLDTEALRTLARRILATSSFESADDAVIEEAEPMDEEPESAPAPRLTIVPPPRMGNPTPPPVPRRPTRNALTDEDRIFVDGVFRSIADHRDALVAEASRHRPPPRRELLQTAEGRVQLLRDDLKAREAQIARMSEIWEVREREVASAGDRLHEKDVELQGLKVHVEDLQRRLADAHAQFLAKEREHGASIDGLLTEKFGQEKELIEAVAANEGRLHDAQRELRDAHEAGRAREADLQREVKDHLEQIESLEAELESLGRELAEREAELRAELDETEAASAQAQERAVELEQALASARRELETRGAERSALEAERDAVRSERDGLRADLDGMRSERDSLRTEKEALAARAAELGAAMAADQARAGAVTEELEKARAEREGQVQELETLRAESGRQAHALENAHTESARHAQELETLRADGEGRCEELREERDERDRLLSVARRENERLQGELTAARHELMVQQSEARADGEKEAARAEELASLLAVAQRERDEEREGVRTARSGADAARSEVAALAARLAEAELRSAALEAERGRFEALLGEERSARDEAERAHVRRLGELEKGLAEAGAARLQLERELTARAARAEARGAEAARRLDDLGRRDQTRAAELAKLQAALAERTRLQHGSERRGGVAPPASAEGGAGPAVTPARPAPVLAALARPQLSARPAIPILPAAQRSAADDEKTQLTPLPGPDGKQHDLATPIEDLEE